jgi:hypothetical protein
VSRHVAGDSEASFAYNIEMCLTAKKKSRGANINVFHFFLTKLPVDYKMQMIENRCLKNRIQFNFTKYWAGWESYLKGNGFSSRKRTLKLAEVGFVSFLR